MSAQSGLLRSKRVGLYISSSNFDFQDFYYLSAAQFLKIKEDRSYAGELKSELLIRIGETLCPQLQSLAEADTVYFVNADIDRGVAFQKGYNSLENKLEDPLVIPNTDLVLVINKLELSYRSHRSVFIRSNQMFTEKIKVKKAQMAITFFDPSLPELALEAKTCYDEFTSDKVAFEFDFYREESKLGEFFSQLFSQWWWQIEEGVADNCAEN